MTAPVESKSSMASSNVSKKTSSLPSVLSALFVIIAAFAAVQLFIDISIISQEPLQLRRLVTHLTSRIPPLSFSSSNVTDIPPTFALTAVEDPQRSFSQDDFETHFGIYPLQSQMVDPAIAAFLDAHDITNDEMYQKSVLSMFLEKGFKDDKRFKIKWISPEKGYGVFAAVNIGATNIVGEYVGVVTNNTISDYIWNYPSEIKDEEGRIFPLGIDSRFAGNFARLIRAGEEITVSYGDEYWTSRANYRIVGAEEKK
ncbi:hypothetical protein BC829DRAFT_386685 [Chytridium lagenaria]|nr:hypothetical protein BC829DRAFT_386685 [Chytridium lagenaria]